MNPLIKRIQQELSDDLRRPPWKGSKNKLAGHCYIACEALFHITRRVLRPYHVKHLGQPHWFLIEPLSGKVIDPTAGQFKKPVPYHLGRCCGFLTQGPSKRAQILLDRLKGKR